MACISLVSAPAPVVKGAEPAPPPPAVGSWVSYSWDVPKKPKSTLRFAVVGGDASGRRRIEIEVVKAGHLARFGYDLLPDGTRTRQVAQLGQNGAALLFDNEAPKLPDLPKIDPSKVPKKRESKGYKTIKVPAGTFRCRIVQSVQGEACIDEGLMPMKIVRFKGKATGSMILTGRGFDARPRILAKPRPVPTIKAPASP